MWTLASSLAEKESFESQKIATLAKDGEQDITSQEVIETLQSTEAPTENTTPTQDQDIQPEQEENNEIVKDSESNLIVAEEVTEDEPENIVGIEIAENEEKNGSRSVTCHCPTHLWIIAGRHRQVSHIVEREEALLHAAVACNPRGT